MVHAKRKSQMTNMKRYLCNTMLIFFVVLWSVASYIQWLAGEQQITYSTQGEPLIINLELQRGDILTQEIRINRYIDNLMIKINNGGGNRVKTNKGMLRFTLRQEDIVESYEMDINGLPDWTYQGFQGSLKNFREGTAVLEIEAVDTEIGSSVFIPYLKQDYYELPPAILNGTPLSGALQLQYETGSPVTISTSVYVVGALLLVTILGVGAVLAWFPKDALIYGMTVLLVFLIVCFKYPTYTIGGEICAEVGTIYLPAAKDQSFFQNLIVLEGVWYLNILGRLVSWFAVHCTTSLRAAVLVINLMSLLLVAMMGSALATGALKKYITPLESVVISVLIVTCLVNGETVAPALITAYWGLIPLLILLATVVFEIDISNKLYWLFGGMAVLSTLSRMYYVVFIPIILLLVSLQFITTARRKKASLQYRCLRHRDWAFFIAEICACLIQGIGSLVLRAQHGYAMTGEGQMGALAAINPLKLIERTLYGQVQTINSLLHIQTSKTFLVWNLLILVVVLSICVYVLVCSIKGWHRRTAIYAAILLLLTLGVMALQILSNAFNTSFNGWSVVQKITRDRFWLFQYFSWLGLVILLFICIRSSGIWRREETIRRVGTGAMALCMLVICSCQITDGQAQMYDGHLDGGDWANYYHIADRKTYAIMQFSPSWYYKSSDCKILRGKADKCNEVEVSVNTDYIASVYALKDTVENQLMLRTYYVDVYDGNGDLAVRVPQISNLSEDYIGFDVNMSINGVSRLEFTYEDGSPAFINKNYSVGYRG